jgi:hypothetical protein
MPEPSIVDSRQQPTNASRFGRCFVRERLFLCVGLIAAGEFMHGTQQRLGGPQKRGPKPKAKQFRILSLELRAENGHVS